MNDAYWDMVAELSPELRDEREFQLYQAKENALDREKYWQQSEEIEEGKGEEPPQ